MYRLQSEGFTPKLPPIKCPAKLVQTTERRLHTQTDTYNALQSLYRPQSEGFTPKLPPIKCTARLVQTAESEGFTPKLPPIKCPAKLVQITPKLTPIKCPAKLVQISERRLHTQTDTYNALQSLYRPRSEGFTPKLTPIKCTAKLVQISERRLHTQTATYEMPCKACTDRRAKASHPNYALQSLCRFQNEGFTPKLPPMKCPAKLVQTEERRLHTQTAGMILEEKSKILGENLNLLVKQFQVPLIVWSPGPLVLWSFGSLVPGSSWSPGPLPSSSWSFTLLILWSPKYIQIHPNQPEIDPKINSRQYAANNTKCCR